MTKLCIQFPQSDQMISGRCIMNKHHDQFSDKELIMPGSRKFFQRGSNFDNIFLLNTTKIGPLLACQQNDVSLACQ